MWFPSDSWGKLGVALIKGNLVAIKTKKKNRKLARQMRHTKRCERSEF